MAKAPAGTPTDAHTYVVTGSYGWGKGETFDKAVAEWKRQTGAWLSDGYDVYSFGAGCTFEGIGGMGTIHWNWDGDTQIDPTHTIRYGKNRPKTSS